MGNNRKLQLAIRAALATATATAAIPVAMSQTVPAPAADQSTNTLQEVVVTGSRIAVPNQVAISPVTFVSAQQIQETGITRVEDLLNQLPQVFASQGSNVVNGSDGTATVNLRGLGAQRTLVLVNGMRLGAGDPGTGGPSDVNMIPDALISSIEVLTGGASSTYGADAVAGVVNFKLLDNFEGVKLIYNGGLYNHSNHDTAGTQDAITAFNTAHGANFPQAPGNVNTGAQQELSFIAGLNSSDGKGNATFYATYRHVASVLQQQYSVSACTLGSGFGGKPFHCSGSSTNPFGRFLFFGTPSSDTTLGPNNTLIPWPGSGHYFNYGPLNYFQRPDERYTAGAFLHYDFNDHAKVYANTMFMDDRSIAQIAPSGDFGNTNSVNCANPFLTSAELTAWCGGSTAGAANGLYILRRNVEGGNRQDDLQHTDFREVLGIKGDINDAWSYDASYQFSMVNRAETYYNDLSIRKLQNALNVVSVNGVPTCQSVVDGTDPNCVPWNIFQAGGVTPAAVGYLNTPGIQRGQVKQQIIDVNFTGDFGKYGVQIPHTDSGLKLNGGFEWHDVSSFFEPDAEFQSGDLAGQGGATLPVGGGIVSREGFVEGYLPILAHLPGAEALDSHFGYRYSDYNLGFKTNTFTLGLDWKPVQDVRLRASFARASRAPNIGELFSVQSVALDGNTDPCAGTIGTLTYTAAQCALTGVTAAQYGNIVPNPAAQYNGFQGGSPALNPETALTSSFGIGWTPSFVPNFRAQIDYYDIKIESVIQSIGADTILTDCLTKGQYCGLIHRDATGSLWLTPGGFVTDTLQNVGQLHEKGVDVDLAYAFDMGRMGRMHAALVGTYLDSYDIMSNQLDSTSRFNCAGYYGVKCSSFNAGAGAPLPRWRHQMRFTWSTPWKGLDVGLTWRYYGPVSLEQLSSNPNISAAPGTVANGKISSTDAHLASYSYIDLTGAMHIGDHVTARIGVNNLLDKDPPVIGTTNLPSISGNGNTFPQVYDSLGRYIFGQVTVQF